ncbi:hypothetical protein E4T56_gene18630 [Termitomyces sp. T112]|nr:hypothetical protein E4T56_gene18630 [Termitomyces sp. T112]
MKQRLPHAHHLCLVLLVFSVYLTSVQAQTSDLNLNVYLFRVKIKIDGAGSSDIPLPVKSHEDLISLRHRQDCRKILYLHDAARASPHNTYLETVKLGPHF